MKFGGQSDRGPAPLFPTWTNILATILHTLAYLAVAGLIAVIVYEKLGLALLRKAWINLDLIWAIALIATGCFVLLI
jgi:hypothetical protein